MEANNVRTSKWDSKRLRLVAGVTIGAVLMGTLAWRIYYVAAKETLTPGHPFVEIDVWPDRLSARLEQGCKIATVVNLDCFSPATYGLSSNSDVEDALGTAVRSDSESHHSWREWATRHGRLRHHESWGEDADGFYVGDYWELFPSNLAVDDVFDGVLAGLIDVSQREYAVSLTRSQGHRVVEYVTVNIENGRVIRIAWNMDTR